MRARLVAGLAAALLAAAPAQAASAHAERAVYAKQQAAPVAQQPRHDDAEQRGHVIGDEDTSPDRDRPTPQPPVTPVAPSTPPAPTVHVVATSHVDTGPVHRTELPRTGFDNGGLLGFFGLLVAGAGVCLRRAVA